MGLQAVVTLRAQHRMAAPIMALANAAVYGGALTAASPAVARRRLALPALPLASLPPWLLQARRCTLPYCLATADTSLWHPPCVNQIAISGAKASSAKFVWSVSR